MNSLATLMFVYTLFTLISSGILYGSFREKMDASAIYFLISELCMAVTCGTLFFININIVSPTSLFTGIPILTVLGAEIAFLFSIISLTNKIEKKWFFLAVVLITLITVFLEVIRSQVQPRIIVLMVSVCLASLFIASFYICRFWLPIEVRRNEFIKWITWFELGMVSYGLIRILGYFAPTPIVLWGTPSAMTLIVLSLYVVMGTFRYISYICLRITWTSPTNPIQNSLNRYLMNVIEDKNQLLKGLIASNRAIGISALASSLAHQLSQPLTTIALRADTIRRDLAETIDHESLTNSLNEISNQSKKLAGIVMSLRQLFGSREREFSLINLQQITDEIIDIVEATLQSKGISLNKEYLSNPVINGDIVQIQQVLINILNNSIDELGHNNLDYKNITIRIEADDEYATITIKDNGAGIDQETIPTIFGLFKTTKKDGLGVGLWICKEIIESHNGSISASNNWNGGALFKIEIPIYSEPRK